MGFYRKRPVIIEAFRLDDYTDDKTQRLPPPWFFLAVQKKDIWFGESGEVTIATLEGNMVANIGDWIIRGVAGEIYPCKDEIFRATYESVPST